MQTTKLYVQLYENNIETVWKKKISLSQHPPPPPEIPRPLTPPPLRNFQSLPWGGYGYFLELHIIMTKMVKTTTLNKNYKKLLNAMV